MSDEIYYTIGEMTAICEIPAKTLRYYDEIGLIKPEYIDPETKYRFYTANQIMPIITVKGLKARKFSLKEIETFIKTQNPAELLELYRNREKDITEKIIEFQKAQDRLKRRIVLFEKYLSESNQDEYEFKDFDERHFVSDTNQLVIDERNLAAAFNRNQKRIKKFNLHTFTPITFILNEIPDDLKNDVSKFEVCSPLSGLPEKKLKFLKAIDKGRFACLTAKMGLYDLPKKTSDLTKFIKNNGFTPGTFVLVQFLVSFIHTKSFDNLYCEIQIPVLKI